MLYYKIDPYALDIFLEHRERMQYVGRLTQEKNGKFKFIYDEKYLLQDSSIPIGPSLPLNNREYTAKEIFPEFLDRIPSKHNPAYSDYCKTVQISPEEKNVMILLATLGKRGPTKFMLEKVIIEDKESVLNTLREFCHKTKLSQRDFANLLDVPITSLNRLLTGTSNDKTLLKLIDVYLSNSPLFKEMLSYTQGKITNAKKESVYKELVK